MRLPTSIRRSLGAATLGLGLAGTTACSPTGGAVLGSQDTHCMVMQPQPTNQGDCSLKAPPDAGDVGAAYGATLYNTEGDDDDCKYHVKWSSTAIREDEDVTFTLSATYKTDGMPSPSACSGCPVVGLNTQNTQAEVFFSDTHPAPITTQVVTMVNPGTYTIEPVRFDAPGRWTVRFHVFELCTDVANDSPHGHAAYYVDVP
jgi:hypothetical protein